jgi:hypothetical protein
LQVLKTYLKGRCSRRFLLRETVEKYIIGIDKLQLPIYFDMIGWQYFQKGEKHKTFMKRGHFTFFEEIGYFVCTRPGKNSVDLKKGDGIIV